ncbi:ABC-type transport auxiliary lipoprotein family protein [Xanthomonas massiliensis]|jgi:cholesterol transport system auxiliary component|uniref:ABC-type transport auxiliary lipoprotein family protein n=1 Tax=Xanthomonas massiliensis TaxID=1720302 RepID=UPI00082621C3|nr:ABC-type transport auxiliary lipoprotein family protein [Xanthomonas massiliensis]
MKLPLARWSLALLLFPLAACSMLAGGRSAPTTLYAPQVHVAPDPSWPRVDWQLVVAKPTATRLVDSARILVRPTPDEIQVYRGAAWVQPATDMLQDTLLRGLEDSGRITGVAATATGIRADYRLVLDLRRFESDYAGAAVPAATIEANAKLIHAADQRIVATRNFVQAVPATSTDTAAVVRAFEQALGRIAPDIVGWTLAAGQADAQRPGTSPVAPGGPTP